MCSSRIASFLLATVLAGCSGPVMFGGSSASSSSAVPERKTYRSEQYAFELTYPASWTVSADSGQRVTTGSDILFITGNDDPNAREGLSVDETKRPRLEYTVGRLDKKIVYSVEDMIVGGEQGKKVVMIGDVTFVFVQHGNFLYKFVTGGKLLTEGVVESVRFLR